MQQPVPKPLDPFSMPIQEEPQPAVPVKKFQFKPAGQVSVSKVIKKVGIFNNDDDEEEQDIKKKPVIPEKKVNSKWLDEDEEEEE